MNENQKTKIICSGRNFFPKGALTYSTARQANWAKKVGYDGLEFLPTWRVVYEIFRYGKLLCSNEMIDSGHRDWRFDRIMEAHRHNKPQWWYQLRNKEDWLFPPSSICLKTMKHFQNIYKTPISVMWYEDSKNFSPVLMELWDKVQGFDQKGIIKWVRKDPDNRGIVIDTLKFNRWLKSNRLENRKEQTIEQLLPYIKSIDYRGAKKEREQSLAVESEGRLSESEKIFKLLSKKGYRGPIVVEFGWPDLEKPPLGLFSEGFSDFSKLHKTIIQRIKNLIE